MNCANCTICSCILCPNDQAAVWYAADQAGTFNPETHEFIWNSDYTAFRVVELPWYDEASYLAYQGDRDDHEPESV